MISNMYLTFTSQAAAALEEFMMKPNGPHLISFHRHDCVNLLLVKAENLLKPLLEERKIITFDRRRKQLMSLTATAEGKKNHVLLYFGLFFFSFL